MAYTRISRLAVLVLALAGLAMAGGCIFVDAQFSMAPNGATSARMEAGVLTSMMEQGEGDFTTDIGETLAEGKWQELEAFERDQWHVQAWEGQAGPGESLFAEGAEATPEFGTEQHLLSTLYTFEMALPADPVMQPQAAEAAVEPAAEPPAADEGEVQIEGMEGMDEAMGEMMAAMMSTGGAGLRFSVDLPGEILGTNGEVTAPSVAAWHIDLSAEEPPYEMLSAQSRLPNWPVIGKLGGQLTQMGRADLVSALIAGVRRGVLPDPVSDNPMAAELNTLMYVQALDVMTALDAAAGEMIANEVLMTLGMGGSPDPAMIEEMAVRLEGTDLSAEINEGVKERLLGLLGGG